MVRTPSYDKRGLKKGTWTPEEDKKLVDYVTRYGCWNWSQLPRFAGLARCGKSCRLRWMNYLRPDVKRGNYTQGEEEIIIRLHAELGNRWSTIAAHLPGRTDNEIKNYWHTNLKKRFQQNGVTHEKAIASTSEDNEFRQERDPGVFQGTTPPAVTSQISDTGPMSPISSSSEFSSITTDPTTASTASDENLALEDDFGFLDAYPGPVDGDFWTEPYLAEISHAPSEIVPDHGNCSFQSPDSTQIPDAGVLSPQTSSCGSLVLGNDFAFLDEYTQPTIENFWTEPYVADMSHGPSELLTPLVTGQSEYFSLVYDADLDLWSRSNLYDEHISLFQ